MRKGSLIASVILSFVATFVVAVMAFLVFTSLNLPDTPDEFWALILPTLLVDYVLLKTVHFPAAIFGLIFSIIATKDGEGRGLAIFNTVFMFLQLIVLHLIPYLMTLSIYSGATII